jgi:SAM-dependent methyltransferase
VEPLPFSDGLFDAAVSRLSVMFFAEVSAGLREMLRVIKPGGHVSFVVWGAKEDNPFFNVVTEVLDRFVPADADDEDAPGAFRFAAPGKLQKALQEAGAIDVTERQLAFKIEAPISAEHFWELRTEMSDTFRSKLDRLVPDQVAAIRYTVLKAIAKYFKGGGMSFPATVLVVTGRKPDA